MTTVQPESITIHEHRYDTLEAMPLGENLMLLQVTEDGESESILIGPEQQRALAVILKNMGFSV